MPNEPQCPFGFAVPKGRKAHPVPEQFRSDLARLHRRFQELNKFNEIGLCGAWYCASKRPTAEWAAIEFALCRYAGYTSRVCVEFHEEWQFTCPTRETLLAERKKEK